MVATVMLTKRLALTLAIISIAFPTSGLSFITVAFFLFTKWKGAYKGWEISPVRKSVTANPLRIEWNDVLRKVLLQIVAKINAFPTTAGADRRAITTAVEKMSSLPGESRFWSLKSPKEFREVEFCSVNMMKRSVLGHGAASVTNVTMPIGFLAKAITQK